MLADDGARPVSFRAAATISEADALPSFVRTTTGMPAPVAAPPPLASQRVTWSPDDSWLKIEARCDELARDLPRRLDVAARVVAEVEHDLVGAVGEQFVSPWWNWSADDG